MICIFFFFAEWKYYCNITRMSQRCHTFISKCDITRSSVWRYKLMSQWYHKLLIFWHLLWYLCYIPVPSDCWLGWTSDISFSTLCIYLMFGAIIDTVVTNYSSTLPIACKKYDYVCWFYNGTRDNIIRTVTWIIHNHRMTMDDNP